MDYKEIHSRIAKLARINESIGSAHFDAVKDDDAEEWVIRFGIVKVIYALSENEAKEISAILNRGLEAGVTSITERNVAEIKEIIDSIVRKI